MLEKTLTRNLVITFSTFYHFYKIMLDTLNEHDLFTRVYLLYLNLSGLRTFLAILNRYSTGADVGRT